MPKKVRTPEILTTNILLVAKVFSHNQIPSQNTNFFFCTYSVPILFTSIMPGTRAVKGNVYLETCEHPLKIGLLFTFLYLSSVPIFQKKCEQSIPKLLKKCDEYTLFHVSRTFILIRFFL